MLCGFWLCAFPDPKLRLGIENLPITGPDRFRYDRDFMTMRQIGWAQEFPNSAWGDVYFAERSRRAFARLARQFELQIDVVSAAITRGRQTAADGFMLRHAFEQANDRVIEQDRIVAGPSFLRWFLEKEAPG